MARNKDLKEILIEKYHPNYGGRYVEYTARAINHHDVLEGFRVEAKWSFGHYILEDSHWTHGDGGNDHLGSDYNNSMMGIVHTKKQVERKACKEIKSRAKELAKSYGIKKIVDRTDIEVILPTTRFSGCPYK